MRLLGCFPFFATNFGNFIAFIRLSCGADVLMSLKNRFPVVAGGFMITLNSEEESFSKRNEMPLSRIALG